MMRGRIVKIGDVAAADVKARESAAWVLEGDRGVTFAAAPPEGSEVVAGTWWPPDYSGPPLVSMEAEVADGLGLELGDEVVVNVLGRNVTARDRQPAQGELAELRDQFRAGLFAEHIQGRAHIRAGHRRFARRRDGGREVALLKATARDFPGVVSLRVREALEAVEGLVAKLAVAIRAATAVALLTSVLVLAGALAANRRARMADAVILKILGATRGRLLVMFLIEYALLGAATVAFGVAAGTLRRLLHRHASDGFRL